MVRAASYEKIEEKMKAPNREKKVNDATITSHISTTIKFLAQLWNFLVLLLLAHKFIFHPVLHNSISSSPIFFGRISLLRFVTPMIGFSPKFPNLTTKKNPHDPPCYNLTGLVFCQANQTVQFYLPFDPLPPFDSQFASISKISPRSSSLNPPIHSVSTKNMLATILFWKPNRCGINISAIPTYHGVSRSHE